MNPKHLPLLVFVVVVVYLIVAGIGGWWPWNVQVAVIPNNGSGISVSWTPSDSPLPASPTATPETVTSSEYALQCQGDYTGEIFKGQAWYEYIKGKVLPGWFLNRVCHNAELKQAVYFRTNFDTDKDWSDPKDRYSQFGVYDISKDDFVVGSKKKLKIYQSCENEVSWLKTGQIIYKCVISDEGSRHDETYSFDISSGTEKLIRQCAIVEAKETCTDF
ncbi:MAG: hypothetical protein Q7S32_03000 [bacterium]|nr:hypothetical protein [bacterium]